MSTKGVNALKHLRKLMGKDSLTFGEMVENIRICDKLSQKEFAKRLKISPAHLCDIEKDRKTVSPARAAKFAKILGYSQETFVQYAIQGLLDDAGIKMRFEIKAS